MLDEIRDRVRKQPFESFVIHLADGRELTVPHPEFLWLPEPGWLFYFHEGMRSTERINPSLIVSVQTQHFAPEEQAG